MAARASKVKAPPSRARARLGAPCTMVEPGVGFWLYRPLRKDLTPREHAIAVRRMNVVAQLLVQAWSQRIADVNAWRSRLLDGGSARRVELRPDRLRRALCGEVAVTDELLADARRAATRAARDNLAGMYNGWPEEATALATARYLGLYVDETGRLGHTPPTPHDAPGSLTEYGSPLPHTLDVLLAQQERLAQKEEELLQRVEALLERFGPRIRTVETPDPSRVSSGVRGASPRT